METVGAVVLVLGFAGCMVYWMVLLYNVGQVQHEIQNVKSTPIETSDNESTKAKFKDLLEQAQFSMMIYDDGDNVDGSIYKDEEITELVVRKLKENPNFRIRCLFNVEQSEQRFRIALKEFFPQAEIRTRDQTKPRLAIHYKIIDDGAKACLSRHSPGSSDRRFRVVDCTAVAESSRNRVSDVVLGMYKKDFHQAFKAAKTDC